MKVIGLETGMMAANAYIVYETDSKEAVIIDPGAEAGVLVKHLAEKDLQLTYILLTHGHSDHIGAAEELREKYKCKIVVHKNDADMLVDARKNVPIPGYSLLAKPADIFVKDGDKITLGNLTFLVMETPGHTPGSVCYIADNVIFSGDTIFAGSIGRTDFAGGSIQQMQQSLQRLYNLSGDYKILSGHGGETTLKNEKKHNPHMQFLS